MRENRLTIKINKPVAEVFAFTITPPNSAKWIPGIINEETNEWPVKIGTIYKLHTEGNNFEVVVTDLKENEFIEWTKNKNYHCRYTYRKISDDVTELDYFEWVDSGNIDQPFPKEVLDKLNSILEGKS